MIIFDTMRWRARLFTVVCAAGVSLFFFFSSRRRHTRCSRDWSSDVCSSDLDAGGTWRSAGLTLPTGGPGMGTVRVLGLTALPGGNAALLATGDSLLAAWWDGTRWTVSAPVTADGVRALGFGPGGSAWLLLGGERAETIAGAGSTWRALPPVPAGTAVLASPGTGTRAPGTGGS